jgi:hypothetical protein
MTGLSQRKSIQYFVPRSFGPELRPEKGQGLHGKRFAGEFLSQDVVDLAESLYPAESQVGMEGLVFLPEAEPGEQIFQVMDEQPHLVFAELDAGP